MRRQRRRRRSDRCTACRSRTRTCIIAQGRSRPAARSCAPTGAHPTRRRRWSRLDRAGAIELGRLAMVEFAMGPHGYNQNYPHCRNPWNPEHIPCGSSSGSGVAVGGAWSMRRWARIRAARSAALPRFRASSASCRPMAGSAAVARCRCRTRSTSSARWPGRRAIARACWASLPAHDPADASSLDVPVPDYEAALGAARRCRRSASRAAISMRACIPTSAKALDRAADDLRRPDSSSRMSPCRPTCSTKSPSCIRWS